ncbi:hypothetical protein F3J24_20995 [Comamonas sp. Tr-654]|nr:hypothetical protein [Comamonas sp. Tr-654]
MLWSCLNETGASGGLILRLFPILHGIRISFQRNSRQVSCYEIGVANLKCWSSLFGIPPLVQRCA